MLSYFYLALFHYHLLSVLDIDTLAKTYALQSMLRLCECRMMLASILPNLSNFDVKMTSNRGARFGIAREMLYLCCRNVKSDAHGARRPRERSGRALRTEQSRREAGKSYEEGNTEDDDTGDCIDSDGCTDGNGNGEL